MKCESRHFGAYSLMRIFVFGLLAWSATAVMAAPGFLSENSADRLSTVPHDKEMQRAVESSRIDLVAVRCEGWSETVVSFARLKVHELTGRSQIHGQDPSYTILSMIYQNELWLTAKIFPVENPDLGKLLGVNDQWISAKDLLSNPNTEKVVEELKASADKNAQLTKTVKLLNAVEQTRRLGAEDRVLTSFETDGVSSADIKRLMDSPAELKQTQERRELLTKEVAASKRMTDAGSKLLGRVKALGDLPAQFLIVPDTESVDDRWIRPLTEVATEPTPMIAAAKQFDISLQQAFLTDKPQIIREATEAFLPVVERSRFYPTQNFRRAENWYVQSNPWSLASYAYLAAALSFAAFMFFRTKKVYGLAFGLMSVGFLLHTAGIALRLYFRGAAPVSNMFESITFCSWAVMLIATFVEGISRKAIAGVGASIIAFLLLTAAGMMPLHDSRLHPLRAVLDSYWLNIHVTMMLLSYAAFSIATFFSVVYLIKNAMGRESLFGREPLMTMAETEQFSYRLVQLGWPILTFGVTLGAVWADTAWGRYWGWDPKETWAFITWCTYTVYLHTRMVMGWRGTKSAIACVVGFAMVLITWLGVSYLPWFSGGLHTYASPN